MSHGPQTTEYICIAPEQGQKLDDYFDGLLQEAAARRFEAHLFLCFYCQEQYLKLDWISETFGQKPAEFFPPPPEHHLPHGWQRRWPYALAASFLIISLSLGIWILSLRRQAAQQVQAVAAARQSLEAVRRQLEDAASRSGQSEAQVAALRQSYESQITALRQTVEHLSQPQLNIPVEDLDPRSDPSRQGHSDAIKTIQVPAGANFFTVILNLADDHAYPHYMVEIVDQHGQKIWQGRGLQKTSFDTFTLALSRPLFPAGFYRINLYGLHGGRNVFVEEYALRIRYQ